MVTLRLYRRNDPAKEIDRRELAQGELSIGRDPIANWQVPDPTNALSRLHCVVALKDGRLTLRDESTNGVFLSSGERPPHGVESPVEPGERIVLGGFLLALDGVAAPAPGEHDAQAGKLLDAFCAGAQIDPSLLAGEDPHEMMRRVGAIYRQMVIGLGDLMNERTRAKAERGLERTTIQAADNNPFRWAPSRRVAVDLLKASENAFQAKAEAVQSSFEDLSAHQRGLAAGWRSVLAKALDALSPATIEAALKGQSFLGKPKAADLWGRYVQLHGELTKQAEATAESASGRAFREAYEVAADDAAATQNHRV